MSSRMIKLTNDIINQGFIALKESDKEAVFYDQETELQPVYDQYIVNIDSIQPRNEVYEIEIGDHTVTVFSHGGWVNTRPVHGGLYDYRFSVSSIATGEDHKTISFFDERYLSIAKKALVKAKEQFERKNVGEGHLYIRKTLIPDHPHEDKNKEVNMLFCTVIRSLDTLIDGTVTHVTFSKLPIQSYYSSGGDRELEFRIEERELDTLSLEEFSKQYYPLFRKMIIGKMYTKEEIDQW